MKRISESEKNGFQKMVEDVSDCMSAIIDPIGHIIAWNKKAEILTGFSKEELEQVSLHTLISEAGFNENLNDTENLWATIKTKAGKLPVTFTVTTLRRSDESALGYHITMCLVEKEIKHKPLFNTEITNRTFMALHEFQEPVRRILMQADMLKNDPWDKNATLKASEKIRKDASYLLYWIQDMLNYARMAGGAVASEPVDLNNVVELVVTDTEKLLRDRNANVDITTALPVITGNKIMLAQLFSNLISNALKYNTNTPHITISCHTVHDKQFGNRTENWYAISVHDNGIGFEPHLSHEIFNLFTRVHGSEYQGYGIGLALCLKIAEAHGGTIRAESAPGKGSVFTVYFPVM